MALIDPFAKFAHSVVVAPKEGDSGKIVHFHDLKPSQQLQIETVANFTGSVMFNRLRRAYPIGVELNERVLDHTEGFAITDHAHIVLASAVRTEGIRMYGREPEPALPKRIINNMTLDEMQSALMFTAVQAEAVELNLAAIEGMTSILDSRHPLF